MTPADHGHGEPIEFAPTADVLLQKASYGLFWQRRGQVSSHGVLVYVGNQAVGELVAVPACAAEAG